MNYLLFYESDEEFKSYVDRYCITRCVTYEEALKHLIVQEYAKFLIESRKGKCINECKDVFE